MTELFKNSDYLSFAAAVFSFIATIYIFKTTPKYQLVKERYNKLIFPLFSLIEPHLFRPVQKDILDQITAMVSKNKSLSDGKLNELIYWCEQELTQKNYNALCQYINSIYDSSCLRLGLKRRSIGYRLTRKQYQTNLMFISYLFGQFCLMLFMFFVFLIVAGILVMLLQKLRLL